MNQELVKKIIAEELAAAQERIFKKLTCDTLSDNDSGETRKALPENENYRKALEIYSQGINHSLAARELGISINAVKKYYNWLVINGYLDKEDSPLSDAEKAVVDCIYRKKMSLQATAKELSCSVTNVVYRRDSALRKGFQP